MATPFPKLLRFFSSRKVVYGSCVCAAALWLSGCATPPPPVSPHMLGFSPHGKTLRELEEGRLGYMTACSTCHALDAPDRYSIEQWRRIVPEMAKSAKISPEASVLILDYLLSARAELLAGKKGLDAR